MKSLAPSSYGAPALDKGLDILELLAAASASQSQVEIAKALGRGVNEIYRMLARLESRGYVVRDEPSAKYRLSLKLYQMAHVHSPVRILRGAALGPMRQLAETIRESCHLSIIENGRLLVIAQVESPSPISLSIAEGSVFPLLKTSSGHLLLAFLPETRRVEIFAADADWQKSSPAQRRKTARELAAIRAAGFLKQSSRLTPGVSDTSVLIGRPEGEPITALTVSRIATKAGKSVSETRLLQESRACAALIGRAAGIL